MKILLTRNADQSGHGGAEELVLNLASQIQNTNHGIIIGTRLPLLEAKAKSIGLKTIKSPWIKWQSWHGLRQLLFPVYIIWLSYLVIWYLVTIKRHGIDVLHPQNRDDWVAASIAGRITSKRVIWSDHADLKHEIRNVNRWHRNWQGKLVLWASKYAVNVTVVSNADLEEVKQSVRDRLNDKLLVAYNGVFDSKPKPVEKPKGSFVFGVTARLLGQKGLFELIESFKQVNSKHANTLLWLIGDGADRQELESKANGNTNIKFFGYVDNPLDYASSFDVFVFPTYTEGFSLSLIEAAMLELPIITTDVGGNSEIIEQEENGLLIPPKDTSSLTSAMFRMYDDSLLRKRLAKNARQTFLNNFEFGHLVETIYLPLYNKTR